MRSRQLTRSVAFTLPELLVAIAIFGILMALLLVGIQSSRSVARRLQCSQRLGQIGVGLAAHQSTYGNFPPRSPGPGGAAGSPFSHQGISWHVFLLPFVEQQSLWDAVEKAYLNDPEPIDLAQHREPMETVLPVYVCPEDTRLNIPHEDTEGVKASFTSFVGMTGNFGSPASGLFGRRSGARPADITDGLSNTIAIGERPPPASFSMGWWYTTHRFFNLSVMNDFEMGSSSGLNSWDSSCGGRRINWPGIGDASMHYFTHGSVNDECDRYHYWSLHQGGANFLFVDGSVRFVRYAAHKQVDDAATIAGGEPISSRD
jgi:prepilin-type N-terminal cleavage/methylation domain-containing protein/prepilin-type processing-associated H-X9-DG protein